MAGKVWLVGAGPGDPELITLRGARALASADVVLYDALSHVGLLDHCRADAELRHVGKRGGTQSPSQDWITAQLIELSRSDKRVVRLKGGDSFLFARGAEEAEALAEAGVDFEIVPGLSSPVATAAYAGISLTHRDLSSSVTFITGTDKADVQWSPESWRKLATATETICVLMGMRRLELIARAIIEGGRHPSTPAAVIQWGARPEQRVVTAPLDSIAGAAKREGLKNPAVVVIGDVVRLRERLRWYDNRPLFGRRVLVPRPRAQATETARAIYDRAAQPVVFPVIEIVEPPDPGPLTRAVATLSTYDWVLLTSANGVERLFCEIARQGRDARAFGAARIGVIGSKTARAVRKYGLVPDAVASEYTGEGLAAAVLERGVSRALLPRALVARDALPALLRQRGAEVDVVAAYETRPASAERAGELGALLSGRELDAVMFTSSSTVDNFCELLGSEAPALLGDVVIASIGPITSETARSRGLRVDVEATEYTVDGLLDALEAHFAR